MKTREGDKVDCHDYLENITEKIFKVKPYAIDPQLIHKVVPVK